MAESRELLLKKLREKAATNAVAQDALEADKLIKGPFAESQAWALDNPDPETEKQAQLDEAPSIQSGDVGQRMLTPETRHEANKDYVEAAATEVAANAALGGAGKAAQAVLPFIPLKPALVRDLLGHLQETAQASSRFRLPSTAPSSRVSRAIDGHFTSSLAEATQTKRVPYPDPELNTAIREYDTARGKLRDLEEGTIGPQEFFERDKILNAAKKAVDDSLERVEARGKKLGLPELSKDYQRLLGDNQSTLPVPYSSQAIPPTESASTAAARLNHPSPSLSPQDKAKLSSQLERTPGWSKTSEGFWEHSDSPWGWHEGTYRDRTTQRLANLPGRRIAIEEAGPAFPRTRLGPMNTTISADLGVDYSPRTSFRRGLPTVESQRESARALARLDPADLAKLESSEKRNEAFLSEFEQALKLIGHDPSKPLTANEVEELTEKLNALGRSNR
jgi:hypothetical protein